MTVDALVAERTSRLRRRARVSVILAVAVVVVFAVSLMVGNTFYPLTDVLRVILGQAVPGASFTVGELRLPRASLAVLVGISFGIAGVTFQTMLRNPLASPDIIGIDSGATVAAVTAIVVFAASGATVSVVALAAAIAVAALIFALSGRHTFANTRLILIGIGVAAMLDAVTAYVLSRARDWDIQQAMQWLTGSLNGASWDAVLPVALACVVLVPVMLLKSKDLAVLRMGDDSAAALGVNVRRTRLMLMLGAVALLAFATAACGPIAFVAFMAGPIAGRLVGTGASLVVPSALVGALLVMVADLIGQFAFESRYPVGVVTGVLGAPFLIYLLIRTQRSGGSL